MQGLRPIPPPPPSPLLLHYHVNLITFEEGDLAEEQAVNERAAGDGGDGNGPQGRQEQGVGFRHGGGLGQRAQGSSEHQCQLGRERERGRVSTQGEESIS